MTILFFILLAICFFSCSEKKSDGNFVDYTSAVKKPLSEIPSALLGEKEYILLDNSNEDCLLMKVDKMMEADGRIYVLDGYPRAPRIVAFDKQGKAIAPVGKWGQGPEEYLNIADFCIDKNGDIYFIDGRQDKLFVFDRDFKFKERRDLPFEADCMHLLDNGEILWGLCSWNNKACKGMKVARTDKQFHVLDSLMEYGEFFDPSMIIAEYKFIETDKYIVYNQSIDNRIHLFDKAGRLQETITMDFGNENVPDEYKKNIEQHWNDFKGLTSLANFVVVTDEVIAGNLVKHQKTIPFIYDRKHHISYEGAPGNPVACEYQQGKWMTYLESPEGLEDLPDSVLVHLENEGAVACLQELK